ncbi:MAG: hypothetical protein B9S32_07970 [Verrucomicrobia bacterium Tous-C9LFEB]|nr:MAG: hypothetical protein B9S32_07970 [Verrucomicrobia bacterium Tous-C9LFEB]
MKRLLLNFLFLATLHPILLPAESLVPNGDFIQGVQGWKLYVPAPFKESGCKFQIQSTGGPQEASALVMTSLAMARYAALSERIPVKPSEKYRLSVWVKCSSETTKDARSAGILVRATFFDSAGKDMGDQHLHFGPGGQAVTSKGINQLFDNALPLDWKELTASFEIPAEAAFVQVGLFSWSTQGSIFWAKVSLDAAETNTALTPVLKPKSPASNSTTKAKDADEVRATTVLPATVEIPEENSWQLAHPRILFDSALREAIQKRTREQPEVAIAWQRILERCNGFTDPQNSHFLDGSKAFDDFLALQGGSHEKRTGIEIALRRWLTPLDLLSFAYAVTGEERYGRKVVELAMATVEKVTPARLEQGFFYTRTFPTRSLALALDWCYPLFTSKQRNLVRSSLADHAQGLYLGSVSSIWGSSSLGHVWNWNAGTATAWGLAALVLEGETNAPTRQWLFQAQHSLEDYLSIGIDTTGGIIEGPVYFGYGAGYMPFFLEGLKRRTGIDLFLTTHYRLITTELPFEILPGGKRVNNLMDSGHRISTADSILYALSRETDRPHARWLWEQLFWGDGKFLAEDQSLPAAVLWAPEKVAPEQLEKRAATLPNYYWSGGRGLVVSRTGTNKESALFSVHAQQYTDFKHDQADKGQFTFYAYGDDLVIDSGYGNDSSTEKSTSGYAHNQVLIDGKAQLQGGAHARTDGWIRESLHSPLVDVTELDLADAYRFTYKSNFKDPSYEKLFQQEIQQATRYTLFVRAPFSYAVIFDSVKKDNTERDYTWLLHTRSDNTFEQVGQDIKVVPAKSEPIVVITQPASKGGGEMFTAGSGSWKATLTVSKSGKYVLWGLTGTDNPIGNKSDSFFLKLDKGKKGFQGGKEPARFAWTTYNKSPLMWVSLNDDNGTTVVPAFDLEPGPIEIELSGREPGAWCAALALIPKDSTPSTDKPLPENSAIVTASEGDITGQMQRLTLAPPAHSAWLQLAIVAPKNWTMTTNSFQTTKEGVHPRLSLNQKNTEGLFLIGLFPHPLSGPGSEAAKWERMPAAKGQCVQIIISPDLMDWTAASPGGGIEAGDLKSDADFLWCRRHASGKIIALCATKASWVMIGDKTVFRSSEGQRSFVYNERQVLLNGDVVTAKFDLGEPVRVETVKRPGSWFSIPSR